MTSLATCCDAARTVRASINRFIERRLIDLEMWVQTDIKKKGLRKIKETTKAADKTRIKSNQHRRVLIESAKSLQSVSVGLHSCADCGVE